MCDEFLRGLLADAGHAGDVVRRVAPEAEDVPHLVGPHDAPLRQHLGHAEDFGVVALARGTVDEDMLVNELAEILVGRHHVGREIFFDGLAGERANDVVGFVAVEFEHGQVEGADEALDVGNGGGKLLGHFLALRLVGGKFDVARGGRVGVEDDGEMGGRLLGQEFEERVGEAVDGRGVASGGGANRVCGKGEVGAVDEGHAVEKEESVFAVGNGKKF